MVLQARDRYQVRFVSEEGGPSLFRCAADGTLWLTRDEALSHLLGSDAIDRYYVVEEIDTGAPAGNFSQIAVCGMSGEILGPPNHHEYQRNVLKLHAEKFANWDFERFRSRIVMETGEEAIEKWKESVSKRKQYRVRTAEDDELVEETPTEPSDEPDQTVADVDAENVSDEVSPESSANEEVEVTSEEAVEAVEEEVAVEPQSVEEGDVDSVESDPDGSEETEPETGEAEEGAEVVAEEEASADATPAPEPVKESGEIFKTPEELARHFRLNFADEAIEEVKEAVVSGAISGRDLSRGLLEHLKRESESLRRGFPLAMVQALCAAFEKEGLRFFKRGKKALHVSAVRPRPIRSSVSFTVQIQNIVDFVVKHPEAKVMDLLDALADDFTKPDQSAASESVQLTDGARSVLKDLRWLQSEGYLIEYPDTKLALGRSPKQGGEDAPAKKKSGKRKEGKKAAVAGSVEEQPGPEGEKAADAEEGSVTAPVSSEPEQEAEAALPEVKAEPESETESGGEKDKEQEKESGEEVAEEKPATE